MVESGGVSSEKPIRSFEALLAAGLDGTACGVEAKLNSPKSSDMIGSAFGTGGGATAVLDAGFGTWSKNFPLLKGDVILGGAAAGCWPAARLIFAKGSALDEV